MVVFWSAAFRRMAFAVTADLRRQHLAEFLARRGYAPLGDLAAHVGASESTIRRDLDLLEEGGQVRRTHGGAVSVSERQHPLAFTSRESTCPAEKAAIGAAAATTVDDDEVILIDGGTTTYQLAARLLGRRLQVVTNSLPIVNLFAAQDDVETIFLGGYLYPRTGVVLGPLIQRSLDDLHVSKAFMGASGVAEAKVYNANMLIIEAQQRMIASADQAILLADHTKFGRRALLELGPLERFARVVSDDGLDAADRRAVAEAGCELTVAPTETQ